MKLARLIAAVVVLGLAGYGCFLGLREIGNIVRTDRAKDLDRATADCAQRGGELVVEYVGRHTFARYCAPAGASLRELCAKAKE